MRNLLHIFYSCDSEPRCWVNRLPFIKIGTFSLVRAVLLNNGSPWETIFKLWQYPSWLSLSYPNPTFFSSPSQNKHVHFLNVMADDDRQGCREPDKVGKHWFNQSFIDHGRSDEPGCGADWKKIARFKKLDNLRSVFQNGLAFLGLIGKASLSEFPQIYESSIEDITLISMCFSCCKFHQPIRANTKVIFLELAESCHSLCSNKILTHLFYVFL
jgi:hypothetical protein